MHKLNQISEYKNNAQKSFCAELLVASTFFGARISSEVILAPKKVLATESSAQKLF